MMKKVSMQIQDKIYTAHVLMPFPFALALNLAVVRFTFILALSQCVFIMCLYNHSSDKGSFKNERGSFLGERERWRGGRAWLDLFSSSVGS